VVVRVSRCEEPVRARLAAGAAASLKGARDPRIAPQAGDAPSAGSAAKADALPRERRPPDRRPAAKTPAMPAQIPHRSLSRQRLHPALIPQEVAGTSRAARESPERRGKKPCSRPQSPPPPGDPGTTKTGLSLRRSRVRARRSRRKHPANRGLSSSVLAWTTAGFPPASRTDSAREISREPHAKTAANGHFCCRLGATRATRPRSSRADPACA
jgi:hypothetical protein